MSVSTCSARQCSVLELDSLAVHEYLIKTYWVPVAKRKILVTPILFPLSFIWKMIKNIFITLRGTKKLSKNSGGSELKVSFVVS